MLVTFHHSSYYDWVPVGPETLQPGDRTTTDERTGTLLRRIVVPTPTTTESDVNETGVEEIRQQLVDNPDAVERRPEAILIRHFEDAVLPFHIPQGTITDVTCSDPEWEPKLRAYFVSAAQAAPQGGEA
jgi:hypothetical protein